jgi:hypothetical protein
MDFNGQTSEWERASSGCPGFSTIGGNFMEEIFNPSLIISLGPSGRKSLDFSKKLLGHLPAHFSNLIHYYEVESLESISKELQEIIDTKLLLAKHLNKLVDLGCKVRSEHISAVKLNLYLLWDVYNFEQSAYEVVKAISELNFGNIDKNQHSGVTLYIIPMMEIEWVIEENRGIGAAEELREIIRFIAKEESMLAIDSKVYVLHCVSKDGTRISMEELEQASGMVTYLNILPSKNPPLSRYNRRLLKNEAAYKLGTIGITSLTVFKDRFLEDISKYLSIDILKHASEYEADENYKSWEIFKLISYENQKHALKQGANMTVKEEVFNVKLPEDINEYAVVFKAWEKNIEDQYLNDIKIIIDKNAAENRESLIKGIEVDFRHVVLNSSLKEAVKYINVLEQEITKQRRNYRSSVNIDTSKLNEELQAKIEKYPRFIVKLNNSFFMKELYNFMDSYKEQVIKKAESQINDYIEKTVEEVYKNILRHLAARKEILFKGINNAKELSISITPVQKEEETEGSLITDLFNFQDRYDLYKEKCPKALEAYKGFLTGRESFEQFADKELSSKLKDYSQKVSQTYADLDFAEYISFKYKDNLKEELCKWTDRAMVKSKYLLQFTSGEALEEHLIFITSPKVYEEVKDISSQEKLPNSQAYTNSMSIIRLCLGINIDNIASL